MPATELGLGDSHWQPINCNTCTYLGTVTSGISSEITADLYWHDAEDGSRTECLAKFGNEHTDFISRDSSVINMKHSAELFCAITLARLYGLYNG